VSGTLGEALQTARRARGLTQPEVAEAALVTQVAVSRYENGERTPDTEVLGRLAGALGVTPELLNSAGRMRGAMAVDTHMRRRKTARPTVWRQLEAQLNMLRLHTRYLFEEVSLQAQQIVPQFDPVATRPDDAARLTRMQWRMPVGPVHNLIGWVEAAGCVVVEEDFSTARVDGLSQWVDDHPVILMNISSPTDRKRLTLAHELGHLCLHSVEVTEDMETEANAFAAEFLMPAEVIRPQLRNLTIGRLYDLKREWGVSMQALIERAYSLKVLTATQRTSLYKRFSSYGWRTREPISEELSPEHAQLASHIGSVLIEKCLTASEISRIAGYADSETVHPFQPARLHLRSV
jgi:Zn-dependent peptidase ImmA (M78 family)/DNA-binding XRE family transcriptional regulator